MKIITQLNLFEEQELGDLEKILTVLKGLPETDLFERLEAKRKYGRKDYSVQSYFIAYIAKFILQLETDQQLLRQLRMNRQLRQICGFETHGVKLKNGTIKLVNSPSSAAYSRFLRDLTAVFPEVKEWVQAGIMELYSLLPDFGEEIALDGKIIETYASPHGQNSKKRKDNRADLEADFTVKEKFEGNKVVKKETYYGFRCHLMVDAKYELPIDWEVRPASHGEPTVAKELVKNLSQTAMDRARKLMADKNYSGKPLQNLLEDTDIIPIIDNPHRWKQEETRQYLDTELVYNQSGEVFWVDAKGREIQLQYKGYDKSSDSLRYGFYPQYHDKRQFRLKRSVEPIIFNKIGRDRQKFKNLYKKRTAVERVNGRLDRDFRLENHTIRGLKKMSLTVAMSFLIMTGFALAKLKAGEAQHLASWVA